MMRLSIFRIDAVFTVLAPELPKATQGFSRVVTQMLYPGSTDIRPLRKLVNIKYNSTFILLLLDSNQMLGSTPHA